MVRVIVWHTFGIATITYLFAAMPAMFFVTGSLLAKSFGRRPPAQVWQDRFVRLLVPLWAFGIVAWTAMIVAAHRTETAVPWRRIWAWILPLGDPHGSAWEASWMSSPLWCLRAIVWLMLASPVLWWAVRRHQAIAFGAPLVAVFALDIVDRHPTWSPAWAPRLPWQTGDFALYSLFFMAGFVDRGGGFERIRRRQWLGLGAGFALAATAWRLTQPVPLGVVNNSHPLHLLVGSAWLSFALAAQPLLAAVAAHRLSGPVVRVIAQRAFTIYLWHSTVIIIALNIVDQVRYPSGLRNVALIVLIASGTTLAVVLFGWIEDLSARRAPRLWPHDPTRAPRARRAVLLAAVPSLACLFVAGLPIALANSEQPAAAAQRPPVPSKQPPRPAFTRATNAPSSAIGTDLALGAVTGPPAGDTPNAGAAGTVDRRQILQSLQLTLEKWATIRGVPGVIAIVSRDSDVLWSGATGMRPEDRRAMTTDDPIEAMSVTKLFTAALVYRYADAGLIALDAPVPPLTVAGVRLADQITPRLLLSHRSGLLNYRETPAYLADPNSIASPRAPLRASAREPLVFPPGTAYSYSSSGYLALGFLLEQVTGRSYDELLRTDLIEPLSLVHTSHRGPGPGLPNQAASGIESNLAELARATTAILRDHIGFSGDSLTAMTAIDPNTGAGAGAFGLCPCTTDATGAPHFSTIGHFGGTTLVAYAPATNLTVVVDVADTLWLDGRPEATAALILALSALAAPL